MENSNINHSSTVIESLFVNHDGQELFAWHKGESIKVIWEQMLVLIGITVNSKIKVKLSENEGK